MKIGQSKIISANVYYHGTTMPKAELIKAHGWKPLIVMPNGIHTKLHGNFFSKNYQAARNYTKSAQFPAIVVVSFLKRKFKRIKDIDELWHKSNADYVGFDGLIIPSTVPSGENVEYLVFDPNASTKIVQR